MKLIPQLKVKRILVTRTDRIGDLVLSTPVFTELRQRFPEAHISVLVRLEHREIVEGNPHIHEVLLYDKEGNEKGWWGNLKFAFQLAQKKFDLVIHLHATNRMHFVTWLARIPFRVGWSRRLPWALTHAFEDLKREGKKHEAAYNFELLAPLEISAPQDLQAYFPLNPLSQRSLEKLLDYKSISPEEPWIVLCPGASCPSKRWPPSRFAQLAETIANKYEVELILIGDASDKKRIQQIQKQCRVSLHDFSGQLSLGMLGALLKRSKMLISNDSGPVHIADAVGTPALSIFGRNQAGLSPKRWGPLGKKSEYMIKDIGCDPCLAHDCEINFLCLDMILADEAFERVQSMLSKMEIAV